MTVELTQAGAIGIILATYLLIAASPILGSFRTGINGLVLQPVDYGSFAAWRDLAMRLGQIGGSVLILVLICRWLGIHRDLAGFPRQRAVSPIPAVLTVLICVVGQVIAILVLDVLTPAGANTNADGGGSVDNGWGWLQIIDAVHTSIVEEIIVVAVPVLVGRRAGWHPALVIAVCAFLRWPYHTYHGVLNTLPWALIWGGAYAGAYLYLRRLTPIIVVHVLIDLPIMLGDVTPWADTITYSIAAALVLWLIALGLADRRRRVRATNQPTLIGNRPAQRFLLRHNKSQHGLGRHLRSGSCLVGGAIDRRRDLRRAGGTRVRCFDGGCGPRGRRHRVLRALAGFHRQQRLRQSRLGSADHRCRQMAPQLHRDHRRRRDPRKRRHRDRDHRHRHRQPR